MMLIVSFFFLTIFLTIMVDFMIFTNIIVMFYYFVILYQFYKFLVGGICDLFIESIYQFIILNKLSKVYLVGHSFGAYHAINFAEK